MDLAKNKIYKLTNLIKILFALIFFQILSSCAQKTLVREDFGIPIEKKVNFRITDESPFTNVSFRLAPGHADKIRIDVKTGKSIKEEWTDVYEKVGVFHSQCRGWRGENALITGQKRQGKYCEMDWPEFAISHLLIYGLFYDLAIPFLSYGPSIETQETLPGQLSKTESQFSNVEKPWPDSRIKIKVGKSALQRDIRDGAVDFTFKELGVDPRFLENVAEFKIQLQDKEFDVLREYLTFATAENSRRTEAEIIAAQEKNRPENKYGSPFCQYNNLFTALYAPTAADSIESDCLYVLMGPLKVLQTVNGGILVSTTNVLEMPGKTIFIRTKKSYVDDERLKPMLVRSSGTISYQSIMGANRTVHAFEYLEDWEPRRY